MEEGRKREKNVCGSHEKKKRHQNKLLFPYQWRHRNPQFRLKTRKHVFSEYAEENVITHGIHGIITEPKVSVAKHKQTFYT